MDEAAVLRYIVDGHPGVNPLPAAGDTYFLYDPDRDLPPNRQLPYATLITGDRHDQVSDLDREGVYRLNVGVRKQTYRDLFGTPPTERAADGVLLNTGHDYTLLDTLLPHPVYAGQHWVCVLSRPRRRSRRQCGRCSTRPTGWPCASTRTRPPAGRAEHDRSGSPPDTGAWAQ